MEDEEQPQDCRATAAHQALCVPSQHLHLTGEPRVPARQGHQRETDEPEVHEHRGHEDVDPQKEVAREVAPEDAHRGHHTTQQDRDPRGVEALVDRSHSLREDAILRPREHHAGDGEQHGRQVVDEGDGSPGQDRRGACRRQQVAQKARRSHVAHRRLFRDEAPRHRVIHRGGEQEVKAADRRNRDPDCQRNVATGVLRLPTRLGDGIEPDEGGEEHDGRRHERDELQRGCEGIRNGAALARHERRGEVPVVEGEAADDHHPAEHEHQEHHGDQGALVELQPPQVDQDEGPEEADRDADAHRTALKGSGNHGIAKRTRHVAQEGNEQIRHHADRDREPEPLGEAGDETPPGTERPARIHVATAGTRHCRSQARIGERREHRRQGSEDIRRQHVGPDVREAPEQHEGHHVDRGAQHRADPGRGQAHEAEIPGESGAGGGFPWAAFVGHPPLTISPNAPRGRFPSVLRCGGQPRPVVRGPRWPHWLSRRRM